MCVNARVCFCCSCSINQSNELNSLNGKAFCCCQCYVVHRITDSICTIFLASVSDLNPGWRSLIHISSCHISDESVKNITYSFQSIIQQQKHQTATTCHFFIRFGYGILLKWITHIIWIPQALQKRKTLQLPAIRIKKNDVIFKNGILYVIKIWIRMLELLHYFLIVKCLWKNSISYSYRLNSIKKANIVSFKRFHLICNQNARRRQKNEHESSRIELKVIRKSLKHLNMRGEQFIDSYVSNIFPEKRHYNCHLNSSWEWNAPSRILLYRKVVFFSLAAFNLHRSKSAFSSNAHTHTTEMATVRANNMNRRVNASVKYRAHDTKRALRPVSHSPPTNRNFSMWNKSNQNRNGYR